MAHAATGWPGPVVHQAREAIFVPRSGPLLTPSMALMMVVLTWRQRFNRRRRSGPASTLAFASYGGPSDAEQGSARRAARRPGLRGPRRHPPHRPGAGCCC
nr:DUF5933 domain-containing protein [Streptomyces clavuligerus]